MASSDDFRTMDLAVSVPVSALTFGKNRHWFSIANRHWSLPGCGRDLRGILNCLDMLPLVCRLGVAERPISQPEQIRAPEIGIACAALFRDFHETERADLPDRGRDRMAMNAVLYKLIEGYWELAVIGAAMVRHLDLEPSQYPMRTEAQDLIGRRLEHGDRTPRELHTDTVSAARPAAHLIFHPTTERARRPLPRPCECMRPITRDSGSESAQVRSAALNCAQVFREKHVARGGSLASLRLPAHSGEASR
jgi:hypothetical protein